MFPVGLSLSRFLPCPQSERDCEGCYLVVDVDDMMQMPIERKLIAIRVRSAVHEARERTRKQKHLAFLDLNITKGAIVYNTKEHITLVLIEPFLSTMKG